VSLSGRISEKFPNSILFSVQLATPRHAELRHSGSPPCCLRIILVRERVNGHRDQKRAETVVGREDLIFVGNSL